MSNKISIVIQAQDNASKVVDSVGKNIEQAGKKSQDAAPKVNKLREHMGALAAVAGAASLATYGLVGVMKDSVSSANRLQAALMGLNSVAKAFGEDADLAKEAAQELASDGLMTVADAATGLKNLLAAGFNLDQATQLMRRFKDSAAFGRQSALSFGQAVSSATEGIKNGNSILVDNAGVTKNLSMMLTEAGYSAQDLMRAGSDAGVRMAIFSGIINETNAQVGDAARLSNSAAGQQARWAAQTEILQQQIGMALQPALLKLLEVATPIITTIAGWVEQNPELSAGILIVATSATALIAVTSSLGLAITGLGPIFKLFAATSIASINLTKGAFIAFRAVALTPFSLPAIGVAAAIGAILAVKAAYDRMKAAVAGAKAAVNDTMAATNEMIRRNAEIQASGVYSAAFKARYDTATRRALEIDGALVGANQKTSGVVSPTGMMLNIPKFAMGTAYAPGGRALVGEHGPEIVDLPAGSRVSPSWKSRSDTASDAPGGVTNILSGNFTFQNAEAVDAFFERIDKTQRLARLGAA